MSDIAIRVENLGKQYRIGKRERYRTLRDSLADAVTAPFRRLRGAANGDGEPDSIWALKNVSFEIPKRRSGRDHREKWRRQIDPIEGALANYRADGRARRDCTAVWAHCSKWERGFIRS